MTGIPDNVKARAEQADAALDKLDLEGKSLNDVLTEEPVEAVAPAPEGEVADGIPTDEATPEPVAEPVAPDAESELAKRNAEMVEQIRVLEAQNATLRGKYEAEVPRLNEQLAAIKAELKELRSKPVEPEKPAYTKELLPDEQGLGEEEALGTQGRAAVGKIKGVVESVERKIDERLAKLEAKMAAEAATQETDAFLTEVGARAGIPNIVSLNRDPRFVAFLDTVEPISGYTYKDLGSRRMGARDTLGVAEVFKAFMSKQVPSAPAVAPVTQAKPEVSRSTERPASTTKPYIKMSAIRAFYEEVKKGKYGRNPAANEAYVKRNQAIEEALTDDRIIDG